MPRKLSAEALKNRAIRNSSKAIAALDIDGNKLVVMCSHCGAVNVPCHTHRTSLCVDCGKLYERWRRAVKQNIQSELRLLKPILLERYEQAKRVDMTVARRSANFFDLVKHTEVVDVDVVSKTCKQCGRELPIDKFRKYTPRGAGVRCTSQGYHTICKDCEAISNRAAAALKRNDEETLAKLRQHYKILQDRGLPPVTAAARKVLGEDTAPQENKKTLDNLLAQVSGLGESELDLHCRLLRERRYASVDEAYERHKVLVPQLTEAGLYAEATELLEQWFDEEDM